MTSGTALASAVARVVDLLPVGQVALLADLLEKSMSPKAAKAAASTSLSGAAEVGAAHRLVTVWSDDFPRVSGPGVALALRAAAETSRRERSRQQVQAVWTGPSRSVVPTRMTRSVFAEVLKGARERVLAMTFAAYKDAGILSELYAAAERGVRIDLVVESPAEHVGELHGNFGAAFTGVPGLRTWVWPKAQRPQVAGVKMHAKVVAADRTTAFVTSANLTGYAYEHNLECGLLVRGGSAPGRIMDHVDALIDAGVLAKA